MATVNFTGIEHAKGRSNGIALCWRRFHGSHPSSPTIAPLLGIQSSEHAAQALMTLLNRSDTLEGRDRLSLW